jgi:ethanolamine permease
VFASVGLYKLVGVLTFGGSMCLSYAYGKLIAAMADSRLLPNFLRYRLSSNNVPVAGIAMGSVGGMVIIGFCLIDTSSFEVWPGVIGVLASITYSIQLIGYIQVRTKLACLEREFKSPFGIVGALYALCVYAACVASIVSLHKYKWAVLGTTAVVLTLFTVAYVFYGRERQTFSDEELSLLLRAHVQIRNFNGMLSPRVTQTMCLD